MKIVFIFVGILIAGAVPARGEIISFDGKLSGGSNIELCNGSIGKCAVPEELIFHAFPIDTISVVSDLEPGSVYFLT